MINKINISQSVLKKYIAAVRNERGCYQTENTLDKGGKMRLETMLNRTKLKYTLALFLMLVGVSQMILAQAINQTQNKADQTLRSSGRVNPSTLGMEISIPLEEYPGRAGSGKPITLEYSSKVWSTWLPDTWETGTGSPVTDLRPRFARGSVRGWTTSLQIPRIEFPNDTYGKPPGGY